MRVFILLVSFLGTNSFAATKWTNCPISAPKAQAIAEVFWSSDVNSGQGPTYHLPGEQMLDNAGIVCASKKVGSLAQWEAELKTGINPARSVKSFKMVKTPEEFKTFLETFGTSVNDQQSMDQAIADFLKSDNSIIVGSSGKQALILLANSESGGEKVMFLLLQKK